MASARTSEHGWTCASGCPCNLPRSAFVPPHARTPPSSLLSPVLTLTLFSLSALAALRSRDERLRTSMPPVHPDRSTLARRRPVTPSAPSTCNMNKTFECNIRLKINEIFRTCTCNMCVKHMKHPNKTLVTCNMKPLVTT